MSDAARQKARESYNHVIAMVLWQFQLIEEEIKLYLDLAYDLIRHRTKGVLVCKWTGQDHEESALGRLLGVFEKFTDDAELVAELRALKKDRDHCAHKAFLQGSLQASAEALLEEGQRFQELRARAEAADRRLMSHLDALAETCEQEGV